MTNDPMSSISIEYAENTVENDLFLFSDLISLAAKICNDCCAIIEIIFITAGSFPAAVKRPAVLAPQTMRMAYLSMKLTALHVIPLGIIGIL